MPTFELKNAARWTKGLPHQDDSWDWLQRQLSAAVLDEFRLRYRNEHHVVTIAPQYALPSEAIEIIKEFEVLELSPYYCSASVVSIGYGTTRYPNGQPVRIKDPSITREQAEKFMLHHVENEVLPALNKSVPYWASMSNSQRAALISFAYNLGANFMSASSGFNTIQSNLKTRSWDQVPKTLELYIDRGTPSEPGLKRRRKAEGQLWLSNNKP